MRWPWASHDTLVDLIKCFGDQQAEWAAKQEAKYDALLEKYHALKIQGAALDPSPPPAMTPKAPDPVYEAITAAAGADRGLRASMSREAQRYRAMHVPDIEIIRRIQGGESDEELFGAPAESMTH